MPNTPSRMARRHQTAKPKPKKKRRWWLTTLKAILVVILAALVGGGALFAYYAHSAPKITEAKLKAGGSSTVYDANGDQFMHLGTENRTYVTASEIPQRLKDAVVSIEDRRFYQERWGIDPIRIMGALVNNVVGRITGKSSGIQGGSTLTQQLIKLSVFSTKASDQTLKRKAQEAWLAVKVERQYSKEQILEFYINKVYMDNTQVGMGTAAKYYFGKSLNQLDLAQTALLAGLPQSPVGYNPYNHPAAAKNRRDEVLQAMVANKKITQSQATAAENKPITDGLVAQKAQTVDSTLDKETDAYLTSVIKEVKKKMGVDPYSENLKIYTNLDLKAQKRLYQIVNSDSAVSFPNNKLQTAITITDPQTGRVVAQIGGRKTGDVRLGYNRATQNQRSNGSTMKPLLDYAPAIEYLNWSTYQQMVDQPITYPDSDVSVYNIDKKYMGRMSIRKALVLSRNTVAVQTLEKVGKNRGVNFLKGLGINLNKVNGNNWSSAIGSTVTTEQEAAAYGAFANGGTYYKPTYVRKVVDADGKTTTFATAGSRAMKRSTAYMITDMLKGVLTDGTGIYGRVAGIHEAGKSGTTDYSDAEIKRNAALSGEAKDIWFTGYTRDHVISVWTGYDKPLESGLGSSSELIAQHIYKAMMSYLAEKENAGAKDWKKPSSVLVEHIVPGSNPGTAVTGSTTGTLRELYVKGYGPTTKRAVTATTESSSSTSSSVLSSSSSSVSSASSATQTSSTSAASASSSTTPTPETSASASSPTTASSESSSSSGGEADRQTTH